MFDSDFERNGSSVPFESPPFITSRDMDVILIESMPLAMMSLVSMGADCFVAVNHCIGCQLVVRCSLTSTITIVGYALYQRRDAVI